MSYNYRSHYSNIPIYKQEPISQSSSRYVEQQNSLSHKLRTQPYSAAPRINSSTHISSRYVTSETEPLDIVDKGSFSDSFLKQVQEYEPVIPIEVTRYFMRRSGLDARDDTVAKLISIATQKFISDIILDAREQLNLKYSKHNIPAEEQKVALTPELLENALREHGIEYVRPPYHE